jgi:hypothetical protein
MPTETPPSSHPNWTSRALRWLAVDFFGIVREMRADYLPPLMV